MCSPPSNVKPAPTVLFLGTNPAVPGTHRFVLLWWVAGGAHCVCTHMGDRRPATAEPSATPTGMVAGRHDLIHPERRRLRCSNVHEFVCYSRYLD
jgi:hypothetical protein